MLVLSRKRQEKVVLTLPDGSVVNVILVAIDRNKVQLGFEAPLSVAIDRAERLPPAGEGGPPCGGVA